MYVFYDILKQKKEHKNGFKYDDQQLNFCLSRSYYPKALANYASITSIIADLYTDDTLRLNTLKNAFEEEWWNHTVNLGRKYLEDHPGMARNGIGNRNDLAKPIKNIKFKMKFRLYP